MNGRSGERGHLMVGLVAAVAILLILSTVAFQAWVDTLRRENEAEMIFRAQEIARAIRKFRKDQGRLPNELDELIQPGTRGQYFLRRLYEDPLVKGGKWGLLYAAPGGGILDPNAPQVEQARELGASTRGRTDALAPLPLGRRRDEPVEVEGLPIVGVKSLCEDKPFRVYRGHQEYMQWQFTVFDMEQRQTTHTGPSGSAPQGGSSPGSSRVPGSGR